MKTIQGNVDSPRPGEVYRAHRILVSGWVHCVDGGREEIVAVRAIGPGGVCLGRTRLLFHRPDVAAHLNLAGPQEVSFEVHAALPDEMRPEDGVCELRVEVEMRGETAPHHLQATSFTVHADDLVGRGHWHVLRPSTETLLHREDVYLMGPSSRAVNGEILDLILRYLPPGARLLDVGCGVGPFGPPLRERGFDWFGIEVKDEDCADMAQAGLPHRQVVPGEPLPFADGDFDAAMCIEVLEHIPTPDEFLREVSRVVRGRTVFSVPNFELIPMLAPHHAAPRHMLESDHKNFFTRFSLGALLRRHFRSVEVFDYARLPLGPTIGETLPYHLVAVADNTP